MTARLIPGAASPSRPVHPPVVEPFAEPYLPTPPPRALGAALAFLLGAVARATRRKPLHAVGISWDAVLCVDAPAPDLGVPLLEDRGVHDCTVRVSRALGTHRGWWDIGGVALRIPGAGARGGAADLLFATTGTSRVGRHVLRPVRAATERPLTTLLPTRAAGRSVVFLLRPTGVGADRREYELAVAVDGGPWQPVGLVELQGEGRSAEERFDPIVNELDGTSAPPWVVAMREPAYRWARRLGTRRRPGPAE